MRAVIQRVQEASVRIRGKESGVIGLGLVILLGIENGDDPTDIDWLAKKIVQMRIFSDEDGKMNHSLVDVNGSALIISQFTLHASTKKGNRPSFIRAARPEQATPLYHAFIDRIKAKGVEVATGEFGADMQVQLTNDGPVTIIIDSKDRQ